MAACLSSIVNAAGAETIHVPDDFPDIQEALDAASDDDVVLVGPGTYFGNLRFEGKDVAIRSVEGPEATVLESNNELAVLIGPGGELSGFTLTRTFARGLAITAIDAGALIEGNIVQGFQQLSSQSEVGVSSNGASPIIRANVFRDNSCYGSGAVLDFYNQSLPIVVNNVFERNPGCTAIKQLGGAPLIINNTIVTQRQGLHIDWVDAELTGVRNNIIFNNELGVSLLRVGDPDFEAWEANLLYGNETDYAGSDLTGLRGNLSADPLFVSSERSDFRLQPDSPAIDAGLPEDAPEIDFFGQPRPSDGDGNGTFEFDIGAHEYQPGSKPTNTTTPVTLTPTSTPTPIETPEDTPFGPFPPGARVFVDARNVGLQNGSRQHPFATIQMAIDAARSFDVVGVAPGRYVGDVRMRRTLTLLGSGAEATFIEGTGDGSVLTCADLMTVSGFSVSKAGGPRPTAIDCRDGGVVEITNNVVGTPGQVGIGIALGGAIAKITGNKIFGHGPPGCICDAVTAARSHVEIIGNEIEGGRDTISLYETGFIVERNTVRGRIRIEDEFGIGGSDNRIRNNLLLGDLESIWVVAENAGLIANNTSIGTFFILENTAATIVNNIIAFGRSGLFILHAGDPPTLTIRNNLVFGNDGENYVGIDDLTGIDGNISVDPLFTDRSAEDFTLRCKSPAIDAGQVEGSPKDDILGNDRPFDANGDGNAATDLGAYEYVASRSFQTLEVPGDFNDVPEALDASLPCDTVAVHPGTHSGGTQVGVDVRLIGIEGPEATIIEGSGDAVLEVADGAEIRGLTIRNLNESNGVGLLLQNRTSTVRENVFDGRDGRSFSGILSEQSFSSIEGNVFRGNGCDDDSPNGAVTALGGAPQIVNNLFVGNTCAAVLLDQPGVPRVTNNTIVDNGIGIVDDFSNRFEKFFQTIATNNILSGNTLGIRSATPFYGLGGWSNNLFFNNTQDVAGDLRIDGFGNVFADPMFVAPEAGDFRLREESPAIDAGRNSGAPNNDFAGASRPLDGNGDGTAVSDIGMFEAAEVASPTSTPSSATPPPSNTPTPTSSLSPTATLPVCMGDCSDDGVVTVDDVVKGVAVLLGVLPVSDCTAIDPDRNGRVNVGDVVLTVRRALNGCD